MKIFKDFWPNLLEYYRELRDRMINLSMFLVLHTSGRDSTRTLQRRPGVGCVSGVYEGILMIWPCFNSVSTSWKEFLTSKLGGGCNSILSIRRDPIY